MAVTFASLQAVGTRRVTLVSGGGNFTGSIVPDNLSEDSVMLEFELAADDGHRIVIPVDDITDIVER